MINLKNVFLDKQINDFRTLNKVFEWLKLKTIPNIWYEVGKKKEAIKILLAEGNLNEIEFNNNYTKIRKIDVNFLEQTQVKQIKQTNTNKSYWLR